MALTIEAKRSPESFASRAEERAALELERARAGAVDDVSARAAALFLRIHVETLGQWRRRNPPLGPPWRKGADGLGMRNEHVSYSFAELVAWKEAQQGKTHKQRRLTDELERQRLRLAELELELAVAQAKEKAAKLTKALGRVSRFATMSDMGEPTWWATDGQAILGHVLTVDDDALTQALDRDWVVEASLMEALELPWAHTNARAPFASAAETTLSGLQHSLARAAERQHAQDMEASFQPPTPSRGRGDRF